MSCVWTKKMAAAGGRNNAGKVWPVGLFMLPVARCMLVIAAVFVKIAYRLGVILHRCVNG